MFAIAEIASLWESFHGGRALRYFHFQFLRRANGDAGEFAAQFFSRAETTCVQVERLIIFSDSRSRSLHAIARPSSVCLSSVTLVRPTQVVEIFGNFSTPFGTLAIR